MPRNHRFPIPALGVALSALSVAASASGATGASAAVAPAVAPAGPAAAGIAAGSGALAGSTTYTDPAGDANGAPDITRVVVSHDDAGRITIQVDIPGTLRLGEHAVVVLLDTDRNQATGGPGTGSDYLLRQHRFDVSLRRWNGSGWERFSGQLEFGWEDGSVSFSVDRGELGIKNAFGFVVGTVPSLTAGDDEVDVAPDNGAWRYTLGAPPEASAVSMRPTRAQAGKLFTALTRVTSDGVPVSAGRVTCRATVGGKPIAGLRAVFSGGVATCMWRIPRTVKGKMLRGTIAVTTPDGTARTAFSTRIG